MPRGTVGLAERVRGSTVATSAGLHFDFLGSREFVSDVSALGTVLRDCVVEGLRFIFTPIGV